MENESYHPKLNEVPRSDVTNLHSSISRVSMAPGSLFTRIINWNDFTREKVSFVDSEKEFGTQSLQEN